MTQILTIAKRDFVSYFSSLKAAIIFWCFLFLMGLFFYSFILTYIEYQQQSVSMGGEMPRLSELLTAIFQNVHFIFMLIIPAVTMASFAEEEKTHVDRLLKTAPVRTIEIVMGKFLACSGAMALVLLASFVYPAYLLLYGNPDPGPIMLSYLGMFLLVFSQVAFGIWVSSLTSNQFIAFMFTMLGLFLLLILNWIAPNITSAGWTEQIVRYLASTTHLDNFFKGMLSLSDVLYFVAISSLFLFFTYISLDAKRWR